MNMKGEGIKSNYCIIVLYAILFHIVVAPHYPVAGARWKRCHNTFAMYKSYSSCKLYVCFMFFSVFVCVRCVVFCVTEVCLQLFDSIIACWCISFCQNCSLWLMHYEHVSINDITDGISCKGLFTVWLWYWCRLMTITTLIAGNQLLVKFCRRNLNIVLLST